MRACENGPRISAETWAFVEERLGELWSPEQIGGRLKACGLPSASHEAIYQRIYADKRNGGTLHRALRCQKARRKRYGGGEHRGSNRHPGVDRERTAIFDRRDASVTGRATWSSAPVINRPWSRH